MKTISLYAISKQHGLNFGGLFIWATIIGAGDVGLAHESSNLEPMARNDIKKRMNKQLHQTGKNTGLNKEIRHSLSVDNI